MQLESKKSIIKKSQKDFYQYLTKLENFEQLMPENINKFEVDGDSFLFSIKGMPEIRLVLKERNEFNQLVFGAASSKLNFSLTAQISEIDANSCEVQLLFNGDFNPMMAMMVKGPLQKFIDTLVQNSTKF
jgi:hypothetical protein